MTINFNPKLFNNIYWHLKEAFKDASIRYIWAYGGSSASKTYSVVQATITEMMEDKSSNTLILRKYSTDIRDSIFADFKGVISTWGLMDYFTIQQNYIVCNLNGSFIRFRGLDDSEKVKGITGFKRVIMEEVNQFDHEDLKQIKKRLRGQQGQQIIALFNPISKMHWIKTKVFDNEIFNIVESNIEGKFYNENKNTLLLKTTYRDNRYIVGPEFIDQHVIDDFEWDRINDPDSYDVYANGNWGELKSVNPFATQYIPAKHESTRAIFDPKKQLIISMDFNLNPFAVIFSHLWQDKEGFHSHTFDEASIDNGSIQNMVELIKTRYKAQLPNCKITGDSMGKRRQQGLPDLASFYDQIQRGLGLRDSQLVLPNNPTHENSRSDVNYVLYHFDDFIINPNKCPNLCRDMRVVECDAFGSIIKKNRNDLSQLADHFDCFTGDTLISLENGYSRIDSLKIGDFVKTYNGLEKIIDAWSSYSEVYEFEFSDGTKIECTKDHLFYCDNIGFIEIFTIFEENLKIWKQLLFTTDENTESIKSKSITTLPQTKKFTQDHFTGKCGLMLMEKLKTAYMYIIKTATHLITLLKTLSLLVFQNIAATISKKGLKTILISLLNYKKRALKPQRNGTVVIMVYNGIKNTLKNLTLANLNMAIKIASNAIKSSLKKQQWSDSVLVIANQHGDEKTNQIFQKQNANHAVQNLKLENTILEDIAQNLASQHQILTVVKAKKIGVRQVFDITVENKNCFYANDILVHNCARYLVNTFLWDWKENHQKGKYK